MKVYERKNGIWWEVKGVVDWKEEEKEERGIRWVDDR
jgi:hypothetical protein